MTSSDTQDTAAPRWWSPEMHALRRPMLLARNRMRDAVRDHFRARGAIEIDTAALQVSPGNETHLAAFETTLETPDGSTPRFLHTSPEFAAKKLLAAGEDRFFILQPVYRNGEFTRLHAPEFTMLEWYVAHRTFDDLLAEIDALVTGVADRMGLTQATHGDVTCDLRVSAERVSVSDAIARTSGIAFAEHLSARPPDAPNDRCDLARRASEAGLRVATDDTWSDIFTKIITTFVEPTLGHGRPTLLTHYPRAEAALARISDADAHVAERVELYICGVEMANGFAELTNAAALRERFDANMDEMDRRYCRRYPIDTDFLDAVAAMPPAIGCALGFDRLVMLATGAPSVHEIAWTPSEPPA